MPICSVFAACFGCCFHPPLETFRSIDAPQATRFFIDAARKNDIDTLQAMLAVGKNPDQKNIYGDTALIQSTLTGQLDAVCCLLRHGVNLEIKNQGHTALMTAIWLSRTEIAEKLLEYGADPNTEDLLGETALHRALWLANKAIVRLLLEQGANPDAINIHGQSALSRAMCLPDTGIFELLLQHGANPDTAEESSGNSVLVQAIRAGNTAAVQLLLEYGASLNVTEVDTGRTVFVLAKQMRHWEILALLHA